MRIGRLLPLVINGERDGALRILRFGSYPEDETEHPFGLHGVMETREFAEIRMVFNNSGPGAVRRRALSRLLLAVQGVVEGWEHNLTDPMRELSVAFEEYLEQVCPIEGTAADAEP